MSIALVRLGCTFPLMMASAMALLVCIGAGGCLYSILLRIILMYNASLAMMYNAASFASVAYDITFLMMWCEILRIAPLFDGICVSSDRKKCPPALLRAFGLLR